MNPWLIVLVIAGALALSVGGGWGLTGWVIRLASKSPDSGTLAAPSSSQPAPAPASSAPAGPIPSTPAPASPAAAPSVLRGGTWIGLLERLAITGALLAGYPAAIAFVIAIKGLGRYPELREHPDASERFVIGTLTSMVWAAAVGIAGFALLGGAVVAA